MGCHGYLLAFQSPFFILLCLYRGLSVFLVLADLPRSKHCTSLYYAITAGKMAIVRKLLEFGADTSLATPPDVDLEKACRTCPEMFDTIKGTSLLPPLPVS